MPAGAGGTPAVLGRGAGQSGKASLRSREGRKNTPRILHQRGSTGEAYRQVSLGASGARAGEKEKKPEEGPGRRGSSH